jgi:hypothetical protein
MAYTKVGWTARAGSGLNKYVKSEETDTTVKLTLTPDSITTEGTPFSVANMDHMDQGIKDLDDIELPPTPAIRYSFDDIPDLPDASGNVSGDVVANMIHYTVTGDKNLWTCVASGADPKLRISKTELGFTSSFILCYDVFISILNGNYPIAEGYLFYTDGTYSVLTSSLITPSATEWKSCKTLCTPTAGKTVSYIRLDLIADASSATSTVLLKNIYIGDGTTSQPIIDNVSGKHNATGSGVVSVAGVSGKACQFVGLKGILQNWSEYATAQSWYNSFWIKGSMPTSEQIIYNLNLKDYAVYRTAGYIDFSVFNGLQHLSIQIDPNLIFDGSWHHIVVSTVISSSSLCTKNIYIDTILKGSATSGYDFTNMLFADGAIGSGLPITDRPLVSAIDDWQFGVGEIIDAQVVGLKKAKGNIPKLYTLADLKQDQHGADIDTALYQDIDTAPTASSSAFVTSGGVKSADDAVQANIDTEITARTNADNTLQANINAEETARINADNTLQTNIGNETTARINADSAINTALASKADLVGGLVPASQLPSYVDDVIDAYIVGTYLSAGWLSKTVGGAALTPETGKIYIVLTAGSYQNKEYRWSGSTYAVISDTLALGETSSTAYRGDRGKTAYDHSQITTGNPHGVTKSDVTLGNVPNVSTNNQTPSYTVASTLAALSSGEILSIAFGKIAKAISSLISHIDNVANPHGVTKTQVGLGNCDNTADAAKNVLSATKLTTARTINGVAFDGTQNITTPEVRYTYIVDSDAAAAAWASHASGNDYTYVLVKAGTWACGTINLGYANTIKVVGEPGATLDIIGGNFGIYYSSLPDSIECSVENLKIIINGISSSDVRGFSKCINIKNCIVEITDNSSMFATVCSGFESCENLINCSGYTTVNAVADYSHTAYGFSSCKNIMWCKGRAIAINGTVNIGIGFKDCNTVQQCKKLDTSTTGTFSNCYASNASNATYAVADTANGGFNDVT